MHWFVYLRHLGVQTNHLNVFFFTAGTISMLTSILRSNFRVKHSLLGSYRSEERTISLWFRKTVIANTNWLKLQTKKGQEHWLRGTSSPKNLASKTKSLVWERKMSHRLNKNQISSSSLTSVCLRLVFFLTNFIPPLLRSLR